MRRERRVSRARGTSGTASWTTRSASRATPPPASWRTMAPRRKQASTRHRALPCSNVHHSPLLPIAGVFCEGTFDSWLCWPHTPANSTAYRACPAFVPGFSPERASQFPHVLLACRSAQSVYACSFCSVGAQGMHGEWHVVAAPADRPALVQLHHLHQARGRECGAALWRGFRDWAGTH